MKTAKDMLIELGLLLLVPVILIAYATHIVQYVLVAVGLGVSVWAGGRWAFRTIRKRFTP